MKELTMTTDRVHRAVTDDGTEIAGRLHGQGPALVLVHGICADGELAWAPLLARLTDQFTCHAISTRGRGLSGDHPDHTKERLVEDVRAYADSLGQPVALMGLSAGGMLVLGAAARSEVVSAVVAYEPAVFEAMRPEDAEQLMDVIGRLTAEAEQGRPVEAVRTFLQFVCNDEEVAAIEAFGGFEPFVRSLPVDLAEFAAALEGPSPTDPASLARITAPTLLLHGGRTRQRWFRDGIGFAGEHLPHAEVRELPEAGHIGPIARSEDVAADLLAFLAPVVPSA
jgi:pimeloyl-ACP methyl ester carboxylesterase